MNLKNIFKKIYKEVVITLYHAKLSWFYKISPFDQAFLNLDSQDSPLQKGGVCNGLVIDYARHLVSHANTNTKADFIAKLDKKTFAEHSEKQNFAKRISSYQKELQAARAFDAKGREIKSYDSSKLLDALSVNNPDSKVLGLAFSGKDGGHIIAIHNIKDEAGKIVGYKIFEPNFGEYNCASSQDLEVNKKLANKVLQAIHNLYSLDYSTDNSKFKISCYDLENLVISSGFTKEKGYKSEEQFKGKYLEDKVIERKINGKISYRNKTSKESFLESVDLFKVLSIFRRNKVTLAESKDTGSLHINTADKKGKSK